MFLKKIRKQNQKIQAKDPRCSCFCSRRATEAHTPSKDGGMRYIGHNMSMVLDTRKCKHGSQRWLRCHILFTLTFYYRMGQILQNATAILLQKCDHSL